MNDIEQHSFDGFAICFNIALEFFGKLGRIIAEVAVIIERVDQGVSNFTLNFRHGLAVNLVMQAAAEILFAGPELFAINKTIVTCGG